jgi:hypothetical protein
MPNNIVSGKEKFLAVAFTDLNGDGKFHFKKDGLIAAVVDTDKSKDVTEGDTVKFGTYPDISGDEAGTFGTTTIEITQGSATDTELSVVATDNNSLQFLASEELELFASGTAPLGEALLIDVIDIPGAEDVVFVDPLGEGAGDPNNAVSDQTDQQGDQGFLDVLIA